MSDNDIPTPSKGVYIVFDLIALGFVLVAVEQLVRGEYKAGLVEIAIGAAFLFTGIFGFRKYLKPKFHVSAGHDVEGSIILLDGRGRSFFRGAVNLIGGEPLKNVEARIVAFARDGERIPFEERPAITFAPGLSREPITLSQGVTEYLDIVCVHPYEGEDLATFCILPPWPSSMHMEYYFCLKSLHEIEVVITSDVKPKKFHFTFKWGLKPETCEFSVVEIPMDGSRIEKLKWIE